MRCATSFLTVIASSRWPITYRDILGFDDVSCEVEQRGILGIIGRNGASKNIYPQDIKEIVCSHPAIHDGQAVAFGLYNADLGTEDILVVAEVEKAEQRTAWRSNWFQETQSQPVNRHAQLVKIQ